MRNLICLYLILSQLVMHGYGTGKLKMKFIDRLTENHQSFDLTNLNQLERHHGTMDLSVAIGSNPNHKM